MKTFIAEHNGIYLGGYSVITAKDRNQARRLLKKLLKEHSLSLNSITLEEVDITSPNAAMIWNGDY
jgi:hypothetical protein